jgi:hypothetical protein
MTRTLEEIRKKGLEALDRELGRADAIRFLQQFDMGSGDYAKERHAWVDSMSFAKIRAAAKSRSRRR